MRRSVPAGAESGVRALLLQRSRGIRREVWIFGGPPGPPPGRAPGGPGNRDFSTFFPRNPSVAQDFPDHFPESARNLAGLDPRGTFPPRLRDFPGEKSPEFRPAPRISPDFLVFFQIPRTFPPRGPPVAPFFTKSARKFRDFDRIRLLKVPKEKVQQSVSQAAAVLRRSVPAGAESGVRALMRG